MVRAVRMAVVTAFILAAAASCGIVYMHSPEKARLVSDNFFAYLYRLNDIKTAYSMTNSSFSQNFKAGYLDDTAAFIEKKYGRFQGIRPESYFVEGGSRDIEIFYTAIFENGITYQKITLTENAKGDYSVSSVIWADKPFPPHRLSRKFKEQG